ncbi:MAG: type I secretion target repeat-containing protein, nonfunctional [Candidatus Amesbacteria bacterium GW2011_GWB1_47_19]|nr:MAG: type I secretion target repeat-containing protein, nonfunctional [Candidatus Amesbacteria bacterium GW2011_GWA1_44_24]KKU31809.1 MAG: hypothetical protein UX46_C0002G0025 [Candidatus Amesbacteria bacterium GW2011_GWC1_46_24]KKU66745.1 MAG: type I secretion target repeat-containing protein, nonfunctional [Candidatus Amesbacteria bacterium GW2011_GWB1_47_19]HBC73111.1 hypothetical protein [Candidatus Amesbacteria bacterium]
MNKRLILISFSLLLLLFTITHRGSLAGTARAVGDLTVDWGVPEGQPIFIVSNLAPGQTETRTVTVDNGSSTSRPLGMRGIKTSDPGNLSSVLILNIKENGVLIHTLLLSQFFANTLNPDTGLPFSTLAPGTSAVYEFAVTFDSAAGDEFQNRSVVFDLKIGIYVPIPPACTGLQFTGEPVFGTEGRDRLHGGNGSQLIVSFGGNDVISGGNRGDCILTGPGNDTVHGGNGPDAVEAGDGNDRIITGNGNDTIYAGPGNDQVDSGNGHDTVYAGPGDDTLKGGNGNDLLDGQEDSDKADGQHGTDTCDAEIKLHCE